MSDTLSMIKGHEIVLALNTPRKFIAVLLLLVLSSKRSSGDWVYNVNVARKIGLPT